MADIGVGLIGYGLGGRAFHAPYIAITRGENFQSLNTRGLFPAGEGAGYAGGILSAGVDGIKVAEAVARAMLGD